MTFPQKHEDRPVAPALSRDSRQEDSYATPLVTDPEDVETAIANLELDRSGLDVRHDASMDRSQGTIGLGTSAPSNPTPLELPGLQDATRTNIIESMESKTKSFRQEQPLDPTMRPENRPDLGIPDPGILASPAPSTSTESGESLEPSGTLKYGLTFEKWQSWAKEKKILKDKHEKILKEAPLHLARQREARRKSLLSPPEASSTTVAQNPDPPLPKYDAPGRKSLLLHPEAPPPTVVSIPDPPPKYVPPGTKSLPSPPEASPATMAQNPGFLPPKFASLGVSGPIPAMEEVAAFASRPTSTFSSLPPHCLDASPPRPHDYPTLPPQRLDASPPRRHDYPTLPPQRLDASPPRRHDDLTSTPLPAFAPAAPGLPPSAPVDLSPYRKTFSYDIKDLPTEFTTHPARLAIVNLLELESDNTNSLWCRRSVYTEENFEQWVEWSSPSKTHRDQRPCLNDLNKETLLVAPDLLEADKKTLEDAWVVYRPQLMDKVQQALSVGCDWKRVLQKLHLAFSDSNSGYPRLKQYVEQALQDNVLIKYPLLHADVLFYQLDVSYSEKGTRNPNSTRWDQTIMREPGEDVSTLAKRVEAAYLAKFHSTTITKETIYQLPEDRHNASSSELYLRYKECLRNDVDNPARGEWMECMCKEKWEQALNKYEKDKAQIIRMPNVTPEQLHQLKVVAAPPTLEDIAYELACTPVEMYGNWHKDGRQINLLSASATDPHLIKIAGDARDGCPDRVYRVPKYMPGDLTWRNSLDSAVLVQGYEESREKPRCDEEPRTNHRDRRRNARQHLQPGYKPSKPSSYHTEPHHYETPSE